MPPPVSLPLPLARMAIVLASFCAWRALEPPLLGGTGASSETVLLSLTAVAVLLAVAVLAPAPAAELGAGAVATVALAFALPQGPGRGAVVLAVLLVTLAVAVARRCRRQPAWPLDAAVAGALGIQFLARGNLLVEPGFTWRTFAVLLLLPALGAGIACGLAAVRGSRAWIAAGLLVAAGGGWRATGVATLAILLGLAMAAEPRRSWRVRAIALIGAGGAAAALAGAPPAQLWPLFAAAATLLLPRVTVAPAAALVAAATAAAILLAGYPWLRAEPLRSAAALLAIERPGVEVLTERGGTHGPAGSAIEIDSTSPRVAVEMREHHTRWIAVRSHLSNAVALPAATPVGTVRLESAGGAQTSVTLLAGRDTGEWAARRPDLADLALAVPAAWRSSARDGFFAQEYRAVLDLPLELDATRVTLERAADLPSDVLWTVHAIELH